MFLFVYVNFFAGDAPDFEYIFQRPSCSAACCFHKISRPAELRRSFRKLLWCAYWLVLDKTTNRRRCRSSRECLIVIIWIFQCYFIPTNGKFNKILNHCNLMITWSFRALVCYNTDFTQDQKNRCYNEVFSVLQVFIYVFYFINTAFALPPVIIIIIFTSMFFQD